MSERFLIGYSIDLAKLRAMLGTPALAPKAIRAKASKANLGDIDMKLGDGSIKAGKPLVDAALVQLATNKLATADAYALVRATQLVIDAYGKALGVAEVPFIESHSSGLMNPVFKALGMPTLAKLYGRASLAFPFKRAANAGWPIAMAVEGAPLAACAAELASPWKGKVGGLAARLFTDKQHGTSPGSIDDQKHELVPMLAKLEKWTASAAKAKRTLVMYLDGDQ